MHRRGARLRAGASPLHGGERNSNYCEVALVDHDVPNAVPPVYTCGYSDQLDCIDTDGCASVPTVPGLGVQWDWEFIAKNRVALYEFTL